MCRIEIHDEAELEILSASQYYEERVRGLGEKFLMKLKKGYRKSRK
jgi:hypothetical protein